MKEKVKKRKSAERRGGNKFGMRNAEFGIEGVLTGRAGECGEKRSHKGHEVH